jgi:hypothetical protein
MVETKARADINTQEVQAKAAAAARWCRHASDHAASVGTKPWRYLLVPHDDSLSEQFLIAGQGSLQAGAQVFNRIVGETGDFGLGNRSGGNLDHPPRSQRLRCRQLGILLEQGTCHLLALLAGQIRIEAVYQVVQRFLSAAECRQSHVHLRFRSERSVHPKER